MIPNTLLPETFWIKKENIFEEHVPGIGNVYKMKGIIQRANAKNQNGRIYPKSLLEREINKLAPKIKARMLRGELDHPDRLTVRLENTSHIVTETWWEGDYLWGGIELLKTPKGLIAEAIARQGSPLGISSRASGSLVNQGDYAMVDDDLDMITWDLVSEPSTQFAIMKSINESLLLESKNQIKKLMLEDIKFESETVFKQIDGILN